ncbi:MAG: hypoxanthine-guanine phosphoribosyltransferase [Thiohalomonadales bacterium]
MACTVEEARIVQSEAECCYDKAAIERVLDTMAHALTAQFASKNPLFLCVLNGGLITTAQLILRLNFPLQYDYIHATRYRGKTTGDELKWISKPSIDLKQRQIIIVDDIFDEGITLNKIVAYIKGQDPAGITTAVLVNKNHDRKQGPAPDFVGVEVEDRYVFGYGMDYKGYLRNAEGIFAVKGT